MDISGSQDQMNSMMEDMEGHNQAIKQHNDDLLTGYNTALANARQTYTSAMKSDEMKAMQEGGLNVGSKFGGVYLAKKAVNASGRDYLTSDEAWGSAKKGAKAVQAAGKFLSPGVAGTGKDLGSGGMSTFKPSGVEGVAGEAKYPTGQVQFDDSTTAEVDQGSVHNIDDVNIASNEDHFSAPPGSTDHTSTGGGDTGGTPSSTGGDSAVAQGDKAVAEGGSVDEAVTTGISKAGGKVLGVASKVGSALSVAGGVLDLSQDITAGHIVGDNDWEKASNVLGIVGGGLDAVAEAVPILAPLGALAGLFGAITEGIGLIEHKHKVTGKAEADIEGKGPDPSDVVATKGVTSLQSEGLIASQGATALSGSAGTGTAAF